MPASFPALRVDHVSIAVRAIAPALAFFRRVLPIRMRVEPRPGYDDQFVWTDFLVGDWKLELIESARPGSFVERFLARRGEGPHHLSIDVEEGRLGAYTAALERDGLRIVDRGDYGNGDETAFISPRTAPGILVQFWQVPGFHGAPPEDHPTDPVATRDGVRFRVDHLALAVRSIDATLAWFRRIFPVEAARPKQLGWDGAYNFQSFRLAGYKMELIESARPALRRALPRAARRGVSPPGDRRRPAGPSRAPPRGRRHRAGRQGRDPGRPPDRLHPSAPCARRADPVLGGARVRRPAAALIRGEAVALGAVGTLIAGRGERARRGVRPRLSPSACRHARVHALRAPAGRAAPGNAGYGLGTLRHIGSRRGGMEGPRGGAASHVFTQ